MAQQAERAASQVWRSQVVAAPVLRRAHFPYHSKYFKGGIGVPSQHYGFSLVRGTIKRNALVIIMRKASYRREKVDELNRHDRCWEIGSPQNVAVTEGNYPQGYKEIVRILDQLPP